MPGTVTQTNSSPREISRNLSYRYELALTLGSSGNLSAVPASGINSGLLVDVDVIPDAVTPPTTGFTITLLNSYGVDILRGAGVGILTPGKTRLEFSPSTIDGPLTPTISSAGANAKLTLVLYVQGT